MAEARALGKGKCPTPGARGARATRAAAHKRLWASSHCGGSLGCKLRSAVLRPG